MDENEIIANIELVRNPMGSRTKTMNISLPGWIKDLIDEESKAQNKSKSLVITYLIYCGLKAHVGQFTPPAKNLIRERYEKRGKKWS